MQPFLTAPDLIGASNRPDKRSTSNFPSYWVLLPPFLAVSNSHLMRIEVVRPTLFYLSGLWSMIATVCPLEGLLHRSNTCFHSIVGRGRRHYSSVTRVFDRRAKSMQKTRAAFHTGNSEYDYLKEEINRRLLDRLEDVYAHQFEVVMDMGSGSGESTLSVLQDREDVKMLVQVDPSFKMLMRDANSENFSPTGAFELSKEALELIGTLRSLKADLQAHVEYMR